MWWLDSKEYSSSTEDWVWWTCDEPPDDIKMAGRLLKKKNEKWKNEIPSTVKCVV